MENGKEKATGMEERRSRCGEGERMKEWDRMRVIGDVCYKKEGSDTGDIKHSISYKILLWSRLVDPVCR